MYWDNLTRISGKSKLPLSGYGSMWLLEVPEPKHPGKSMASSHWLVGRYKDLTRFASDLRHKPDLQELLSHEDINVRLGLRDTDVPPSGTRKRKYGSTVAGEHANKDFSHLRHKESLATPVTSHVADTNRRTDREQNVADYWKSQTPQSHHIVEFNNLETLGVSKRSGHTHMDYRQLPAVLLAAEFHQRYITAALRPFNHLDKENLKDKIDGIYQKLYLDRSPLCSPLWDVSSLILEQMRKFYTP